MLTMRRNQPVWRMPSSVQGLSSLISIKPYQIPAVMSPSDQLILYQQANLAPYSTVLSMHFVCRFVSHGIRMSKSIQYDTTGKLVSAHQQEQAARNELDRKYNRHIFYLGWHECRHLLYEDLPPGMVAFDKQVYASILHIKVWMVASAIAVRRVAPTFKLFATAFITRIEPLRTALSKLEAPKPPNLHSWGSEIIQDSRTQQRCQAKNEALNMSVLHTHCQAWSHSLSSTPQSVCR